MTTISKEQAFRRWDTLPQNLRETLTSENSSAIIWKVSEGEHIPPEKIYTVAKIAGWVLMGFLHPQDAERELHDQLGINLQIATSIANALDTRLFSPLKNDLEKIYAPASSEPVPAPAPMPTIIQEINPSTDSKSSPQTRLRVDAVRRIEKPVDTATSAVSPIAAIKIRDLSQTITPKPLGDLPTAPVSLATAPKPPEGMATRPDIRSQISDIGDRKSEDRSSPPPTPAPLMIRREPEFKPLQPKKDAPHFDASLKIWSETKPGVMPIPRPARVDLGGGTSQEIKKLVIGRTENPEAKIIHYSQWTTPPEKTGLGASAGGGGPVPLSRLSGVMSQESRVRTESPQTRISDFRSQKSEIPATPKPPAPPAPPISTPQKISFPVPPSPPKPILPPVPSKLPDARFTPIDLTRLKPKTGVMGHESRVMTPRVPEPPRAQLLDFRPRTSETPQKPPAPPVSPALPAKTPAPPGGNVIDLSKI